MQASAEPSRVELDNGIVLLKVSLASRPPRRLQQASPVSTQAAECCAPPFQVGRDYALVSGASSSQAADASLCSAIVCVCVLCAL